MDEGEAQGAQLPKKLRRREEGSEAQWEKQNLKGENYGTHYKSGFFKNASHCTTDQSLQLSHVTSAVHFTPLHFARWVWVPE